MPHERDEYDVLTQEALKCPAAFPFSLTCGECDAGMDIGSHVEAVAAGWTDIIFDDGPSWNFVGTCPDCLLDKGLFG